MSATEQSELVELIRGFEHLYDGEVEEAKAQGKASPEVITAYRRIVTNAQIIAYLRQNHPRAVSEAERVVQEALS